MPQKTMRRDAAIFCLGAWIMGTVFMGVVATQNFYTIDRLLEAVPNETFGEVVDSVGPGRSREFMRYLSSELNRLFFLAWGFAQIGIGGAVVWLVYPVTRSRRIRLGALAMLVLVVLLTLGLTPGILSVGRALDFVPRDPSPPLLATFGLLHAGYTLLDLIKLGLCGAVAFWLHREP
jgi:hypothetical protein